MNVLGFLRRAVAMVLKETGQLRRDRLTFAMMLGVPIMQLLLFGYAIDTDPHHLPAAALVADGGALPRAVVRGIADTGYMRFDHAVTTNADADRLLRRGEVQFVVTVPAGFTRALVRGETAQLLIDADATDPIASAGALGAVSPAVNQVVGRELAGVLAAAGRAAGNVEVVFHRRYNPEGLSRYNVVPGLLAVILTMTMVIMTALAVTRERERGTMENLLALPIRPVEVMIGKILPNLFLGLVQVTIILLVSQLLFQVPVLGSMTLLAGATALFVTVNLAVGFTFSTVARNQLQAMQMSVFFLLPSILLSGFMFPFRGMPAWAQTIGEMLPATHFMRVVRGLMLKGAGFDDLAGEFTVLVAMLVFIALVAIARWRATLD
jgi:ABC-2 type transport system permease protein